MVDFSFASRTHVGLVRGENQDVLVVDGWVAQAPDISSEGHISLEPGQTWSVAVLDGMGGYSGGAVAAMLGAVSMAQDLRALAADSRVDDFANVYRRASESVAAVARDSCTFGQMGATAAALVISSGTYFVSNVGDVRIMRWWRRRYLSTLSVEDRVGPGSHIVTQALGNHLRGEPDMHLGEFEVDGDTTLLLMSDGVADVIADEDVRAILSGAPHSEPDPAAIVDAVVRAVLHAGGPDNATIAAICFERMETRDVDGCEVEE